MALFILGTIFGACLAWLYQDVRDYRQSLRMRRCGRCSDDAEHWHADGDGNGYVLCDRCYRLLERQTGISYFQLGEVAGTSDYEHEAQEL